MKILSVVGARPRVVKFAPIHVAHRLSTIRESDLVLCMNDGTVTAQGAFYDVVADSAELAAHAKLAGVA